MDSLFLFNVAYLVNALLVSIDISLLLPLLSFNLLVFSSRLISTHS